MRCSFPFLSLLLALILSCSTARALELSNPVFDANVTLQLQHFDGEYFDAFGGYSSGPVSRYALRHATFGFSGKVGERLSYELRAGSATCLAGGAFTLMDAEVMYEVAPGLQFGFLKGEIMRGLEFYEECVEVLTAEKPRFSNIFAPCHPQGAALEFERALGQSHLQMQLVYLDGAGEDLDEEHDLNLGAQLSTPVPGLKFGGFYTALRKRYGPGPDNQMVQDTGSRWGLGAEYAPAQLHLRGEFYGLKGYYNNPFSGTLYSNASDPDSYIDSADLEMSAAYLEAGYKLRTGLESLPWVLPYARFQSWDKASNAAGDHLFSYYTLGVQLALDEAGDAMLRIDFEDSLDSPDGVEADAALLIVRLQASIEYVLALSR